MDDQWKSQLRAGVDGPRLWSLRKRTVAKTARDFIAVGIAMSRSDDLDDETSDAIYAVSLLLGIAGEVAAAAGRLLSEGEHYAGPALVRQIVEIEYLTWTFKEGHRSASKWLRSSHEERRKVFLPSQLRKTWIELGLLLFPAVHMPAWIYPLAFAQHEDFGYAAGLIGALAAGFQL